MLTIAHALNALLMIAIPLGLGLWLTRRFGLPWVLFGWGALTFVVSQVLHVPFNQFLLNPLLIQMGFPATASGLALGSLLLGLSAGFFEELARFVFLRRWAQKARSWSTGLLYGLGHGGVEAMLLGLLTLYSFIQALALRSADLAQVLEPGQIALAQRQLEAYWTMSPGTALLGAAERVAALMVQMSAALMVVAAVARSKPLWLLAAVIWHTLVDALAVFLMQRFDVYIAEIVLFGMAVLAAAFILWVRRSRLLMTGSPQESPPGALRSGSSRVRIDQQGLQSQEDIERSRFQ